MTMNLSKVRIDHKLSNEGKWFDIGDGDSKVLVRRASSPEHSEAIKKLQKDVDFMAKYTAGMSASDEEERNCFIVATTVLLDWSGFVDEDEDGNEYEVKYTPEVGAKALRDVPWLMTIVSELSSGMTSFLTERTEKQKKN